MNANSKSKDYITFPSVDATAWGIDLFSLTFQVFTTRFTWVVFFNASYQLIDAPAHIYLPYSGRGFISFFHFN